MMVKINAAQQDALTEIANIGAGKAAKHLSILLNDTIHMSVPQVLLEEPAKLLQLLEMGMDDVMVGIEQQASGLLNAKVTFLFYSYDSASLAQELVGNSPLLAIGADMRALQYDAITEIGNIVVSSCIRSLADLLKGNIKLSLPIYKEALLRELFCHDETTKNTPAGVLIMQTRIEAKLRNVSGVLIIAISQSDIRLLIRGVDRWIEELKST